MIVAQALAPVESNARTITVFAPVSNGIFAASQGLVPKAVPVAPVEVCQVTCVIPVPPVDVPPSEIVAALAVATADAGVVIAMEIGTFPMVTGGAVRFTTADCDAVCRAESNAVTVTMFDPVTSVTPLVPHSPFGLVVALPL